MRQSKLQHPLGVFDVGRELLMMWNDVPPTGPPLFDDIEDFPLELAEGVEAFLVG